MDGEPIVAPTVRRNPSIKRLLKFPWGGQGKTTKYLSETEN